MDRVEDRTAFNDRIRALRQGQSRLHAELAEMYASRAGASPKRKNDYEDAIAEYQKAIALFPDEPAYYAGLAKLYDGKNMAFEAAELYKKALQLDPAVTRYRVDFAMTLNKWGAESEDADFHIKLGTTLSDLGQTDLALEEYERAIRIRPRELAYRKMYDGLKKKIGAGNAEDNVKRYCRRCNRMLLPWEKSVCGYCDADDTSSYLKKVFRGPHPEHNNR